MSGSGSRSSYWTGTKTNLRKGKQWRHVIHQEDLFPHNFPQTNLCVFTLTKCKF